MYASNGSICLLGDLNSRTSSDIELIENDKLGKETNDVISSFLEYDSDFDRTLPLRHSQDSVKNSHGSKLLKFCQSAGLFIVNGRSQSDSTGSYTFYNSRGASVIDYCVVSKNVLQFIITLSFTAHQYKYMYT